MKVEYWHTRNDARRAALLSYHRQFRSLRRTVFVLLLVLLALGAMLYAGGKLHWALLFGGPALVMFLVFAAWLYFRGRRWALAPARDEATAPGTGETMHVVELTAEGVHLVKPHSDGVTYWRTFSKVVPGSRFVEFHCAPPLEGIPVAVPMHAFPSRTDALEFAREAERLREAAADSASGEAPEHIDAEGETRSSKCEVTDQSVEVTGYMDLDELTQVLKDSMPRTSLPLGGGCFLAVVAGVFVFVLARNVGPVGPRPARNANPVFLWLWVWIPLLLLFISILFRRRTTTESGDSTSSEAYRPKVPPGYLETPTRWSLTWQWAEVEQSVGRSRQGWPTFKSIEEHELGLVLWMKGRQFHFIPKRWFESEERFETVRGRIERWWEKGREG